MIFGTAKLDSLELRQEEKFRNPYGVKPSSDEKEFKKL
jgi:hypothetical protein